jgi:steroid 5-alpha reductase family enzyme
MSLSAVGKVLLPCLGIDFGVQGAGYIHACIFRTEKLYDFCGAGAFLGVTAYSYFGGLAVGQTRSIVASALAAAWAARLGAFLFARVLIFGKDRRFDEVKNDLPKFGVFWFMQGVWVFASLLPILMLNSQADQSSLSVLDWVGISVWGLGFLTEVVADVQKIQHKANHPDTNKWIDTGLWSYSRHPNYFGEMTLWVGMYLLCFSGLDTGEKIAAVVSPLFVSSLLLFASGIPILEQNADKKWGHLEEYKQYKDEVSILIPLPRGSCRKGQ